MIAPTLQKGPDPSVADLFFHCSVWPVYWPLGFAPLDIAPGPAGVLNQRLGDC
jgi:hypothetical protein